MAQTIAKKGNKEYFRIWRQHNKKIIREYRKKYYEKHKNLIMSKNRIWCLKNPEKIKEYGRRYYLNGGRKKIQLWRKNNIEKKRETDRNWRKKNIEKIRKSQREYMSRLMKKNPIKIKNATKKYCNSKKGKIMIYMRNGKYRARKNKVIHAFTYDEWIAKKNATRGYCPMCNKFVGVNHLSLDHIFPLSKAEEGRIYTINDIQPTCIPCNSSKYNHIHQQQQQVP